MKKNKIIFLILLIVFIIVMLFGVFKIQNVFLKIIYRKDYSEYVYKYSEENKVDPLLIFSIIKAESNFDKESISKSNAIGLMQLMEDTADEVANKINIEDFTKEKLFNPEVNIMLGTYYFSELIERYDGNTLIALVAYNAGIGKVDEWIDEGVIDINSSNIENIPYKETLMYVRKIVRDYKIYKDLYNNNK